MARLGEGDPRWIVEVRSDAANVNNWHWTERDCTNWSKDYFKRIFGDKNSNSVEFERPIGQKIFKLVMKGMDEMEGDVTMGNRKGKIYYIYDLTITLSWKAQDKTSFSNDSVQSTDSDDSTQSTDDETEVDEPNVYSGKLIFKDFMHDMEPEDLVVRVTCDQDVNSEEAKSVISLVKLELSNEMRKRLMAFPRDLAAANADSILLPVPDKSDGKQGTTSVASSKSDSQIKATTSLTKDTQKSREVLASETLISVAEFELEEEFFASAHDVFLCMTDAQRISAWTGSMATFELGQSLPFSMFNGLLTGFTEDFRVDERLVQKWRLREWPEDHYSHVEMMFRQKESCTIITLVHSNVPSYDLNRTKENWRQLIFNRIKGIFGMGALY